MMTERVLGSRYRLVAVLGDGGMARVYRAVDERLDRVVAVKILHSQYNDQPAFVTRFEREAKLAANLSHPNIVDVYDIGHDEDGTQFIVMEYVDGENLKTLVGREAPLPLPLIAAICRQICLALDYAHAHGVIHRDVKPENIFLTASRDVKVGDYGIARALGESGVTSTGMVLGSASYFSPEQAQGQPVTPVSDLYSTGMVLYEMLTGRVPFTAESALAVAMKQITDVAVLPSAVTPGLPSAVDAVVMKAIAKAPARRYQSGEALASALERAVDTAGSSVLPTATHVAPAPSPVLAPETVRLPGTTRGAHAAVAATAATAVSAPLSPAAPRAASPRSSRRRPLALLALLFLALSAGGAGMALHGAPPWSAPPPHRGTPTPTGRRGAAAAVAATSTRSAATATAPPTAIPSSPRPTIARPTPRPPLAVARSTATPPRPTNTPPATDTPRPTPRPTGTNTPTATGTPVPTARPTPPAATSAPTVAQPRLTSDTAKAAVQAVWHANDVYMHVMNDRDTSGLSSAFGSYLAAVNRGVAQNLIARHQHWAIRLVAMTFPDVTVLAPDTVRVTALKTESATLLTDAGQVVQPVHTYTTRLVDVVQNVGGHWLVQRVG